MFRFFSLCVCSFIFFSLIFLSRGYAASYTSVGTGDWDISGTWDNGVPNLGNNDAVTITAGHTVTKTGDLTVGNQIVFHVYGTLIINGTLDADNQLQFNIYSGGAVQISNDMIIKNSDNVDVDGSLEVGGDVSVGSSTTLSGSGTVIIDGSCTDGTGGFCSNGPLPVELLYFDAFADKNQIALHWSTASELNNDFFTLEKSQNGKDFGVIGMVKGQGTKTEISEYRYRDNSPSIGLSYYRLSQTDYDGTSESFPIISVVYEGRGNNLSISPNPLYTQTIRLNSSGYAKSERLMLNVLTLQGRPVESIEIESDYSGNIDQEFVLNNKLMRGAYIFELDAKTKKESVKVIAR